MPNHIWHLIAEVLIWFRAKFVIHSALVGKNQSNKRVYSDVAACLNKKLAACTKHALRTCPIKVALDVRLFSRGGPCRCSRSRTGSQPLSRATSNAGYVLWPANPVWRPTGPEHSANAVERAVDRARVASIRSRLPRAVATLFTRVGTDICIRYFGGST